ncbi:uncharacterized protein Dana_GF27107 [Drosophila ananassae]|uniref:RING-type domain-containing protein n=1 Tax=Drosophila ananassae TaxID=7217 RepID=A0A0P8YNU8_DROAN|nr:uncharacterized protein LOC26514516 [Drosophila ananassae]KPU80445.1 uncharacterized protein Dana_GF27107 [Drosophila ananassae]
MSENSNNEPTESTTRQNPGDTRNSLQVIAIVQGVNEAGTPTGNEENRPEAPPPVPTTCTTCGSRTIDPSVVNVLRNCNALPNDSNEGNNLSIYFSRPNQPPTGESPSGGQPASVPPIEININVSYMAPITVGIASSPGGQVSTPNARPVPALVPLSSSNRNPNSVYVHIQNGSTAASTPAPTSGETYLPTNCETLVRCSICFRPANINHPRVTTCGHVFCGPCLEHALRLRFNCPICGMLQEYRQTLPIFL